MADLENTEKKFLPLEIVEEIMLRIDDGKTLASLRNVCKLWKDVLDSRNLKLSKRWCELCLKLPKKACYDILDQTNPKFLQIKDLNFEHVYKSYCIWESLNNYKWEDFYTHYSGISSVAISGPWLLIASIDGYLKAYNFKTRQERDLFFSHTVISSMQLYCSESSDLNLLENILHDELILQYKRNFATFNLHTLTSQEYFNGPQYQYNCKGYFQSIRKQNGRQIELILNGNKIIKTFDDPVEVIGVDSYLETICIKDKNKILFFDKTFEIVSEYCFENLPSGTTVVATKEIFICYSRHYLFFYIFNNTSHLLLNAYSIAMRTITFCKFFANKLIISSEFDIRIYDLKNLENVFNLPNIKPIIIKTNNYQDPIKGFDVQIHCGKPVLYVWIANKIKKIHFC